MPVPPKPKASLQAQWAYVQLPALQLEYWQTEDNLADHPLVVVCEKRRVVVQCNDRAEELGVHVGMGLADAWLLSDGLLHQFHRQQVEAAILQTLATRLYVHFADIGLDSQQQGLWLNLQGLNRLFQSQQEVSDLLARVLHAEDMALSYQLTFASNPCLAQLGIDDINQPFTQAIETFPLRHCYISPSLQYKLNSMGIVTLGQLLKVPTQVLGKKLGHEVVRYVARLQGQVDTQMQFFQPRQNIYLSRQLNAEVHTWGALQFACKSLLQGLEKQLNTQQQATQALSLWLFDRSYSGDPGFPPQAASFGASEVRVELARPDWQAAGFFNILQLKMEQVRFAQPIVDIALEVKDPESRVIAAPGLYAGGDNATDLDALLNRLHTRCGGARFYALESASSWLPEAQQHSVVPGQPITGLPHHLESWRPPWLINIAPTDIELWVIQGQPQRLAMPWWGTMNNDMSYRDYMLAQFHDGRWGWIFYQTDTGNPDLTPGWYQQGWAS